MGRPIVAVAEDELRGASPLGSPKASCQTSAWSTASMATTWPRSPTGSSNRAGFGRQLEDLRVQFHDSLDPNLSFQPKRQEWELPHVPSAARAPRECPASGLQFDNLMISDMLIHLQDGLGLDGLFPPETCARPLVQRSTRARERPAAASLPPGRWPVRLQKIAGRVGSSVNRVASKAKPMPPQQGRRHPSSSRKWTREQLSDLHFNFHAEVNPALRFSPAHAPARGPPSE